VGVSAKAGADAFVAAKTSFLSKKDGTLATDDMWVQLGNKTGDIKLGRFEAADLFPLISDTLVNHAGTVYGTNALRGRMGSDVFHAAGTLNLGGSAALEIGYIDGTKTTLATNAKGARAVASFSAGPLSARIGVESGEYATVAPATANKVEGWGLTTTYDAGSFKVTGNYAAGKSNAATDNNQTSLGLSVGVGGFGAGVVTAKNDQVGGDIKVNTAYVAYAIPLFGVKGASMTPAISTSNVKDSVANTSKDENAFRVRLNYAF